MKKNRFIFTLMLLFVILPFSIAQTITIPTDELGLIEITIEPKTASTPEQAIIASPNTIKPGERIEFIMGVEIPPCPTSSFPGKSGKWELDITSGNWVYQRVIIQNYCDAYTTDPTCSRNLACASSSQMKVAFYMPSAGTYGVMHAMWNNDRQFLIPFEKTSFSVVEEVTTCTNDNHWGDWQVTYSILHGRYMSRPYYTVSAAPTCTESITNWDRKTVCDAGYLIEGTNVRESTGLHTCIAEQQACSPNWQCSDWGTCVNNIERRTCSDGCGDSREESRGCNSCIPNWQCGTFSECINSEKIQQCIDGCGGQKTNTERCLDPSSCTEDQFYQCPAGQTIVVAECTGGKLIETDQTCPNDNTQTPCNNDGICDMAAQETYLNCPNDCEKSVVKCDKYYYLESGICKLDLDLLNDDYGIYALLIGGVLISIYFINRVKR